MTGSTALKWAIATSATSGESLTCLLMTLLDLAILFYLRLAGIGKAAWPCGSRSELGQNEPGEICALGQKIVISPCSRGHFWSGNCIYASPTIGSVPRIGLERTPTGQFAG